jgi:tetratricopeptide (TPR) repeat protein
MRLLHFDALGRPVLTDFRGKTIPPYAILSHRWSGSEILFNDVQSEAYREKEESYKKLVFCAKQAALDKLQYFWVDTCCIDKWNLAELSKAINSMFQWYKNAARCYVFLSDVSVSTTTEPTQRSDWEASFRTSAWFTRGWTLQELIAPVSVDFFSCEGYRLGDKASLDQLIHKITNIPLAALRNCPLDHFTTSERERWAENRRTTEAEDTVYCLLGILGISMPTVYGEGKESAWSRLQAEIEAAASVPSIIPFSQNHHFVGREPQLAELEEKLFSNEQTTTTQAIVGPGGTGKSQLALEVAHRAMQNNKDCSVFWIDASNEENLYQSYAGVAQKLSVQGWNDDQADLKQLAQRCVVEISARQCLLIFDNAEHLTLRSGGSSTRAAADLADYLPQSKLCSVIFTTTNTDTAQALASQNIIALRELTLDMALKMLQVRLARPLANTEQLEAEHLLKELSHLPLAVMQAAACMKASGMTVQEYRLRLGDYKELATEHSGASSEATPQDSGTKDPVAATLFISIDQISRDHAIAADYLFLAACVDQKDISLDLLGAASMQAREDAIRVLDKYALVTRRPAESALDVHQLLHQALRKRLRVQGRLIQWTQRTIIQLLRVFPDNDHRNRSKWRRLLPHAQYALSHGPADDGDEERMQLASRCAIALHSEGWYKEAEELFMQVMRTMKRVLTNEHPVMLRIMHNLASAYITQRRWKEAEELFMQVMQIRKRVLSDEHPDILDSMRNLAATYNGQGRLKESEELQMQVMQTSKRVLGDEHPDTLLSMRNLAMTYNGQGRLKEAEELEVQVMQTSKRVLSDEHPLTLSYILSLAATYSKQGRLKEAEELEVQVVQTRKRVLGDEHPDTLNGMGNLASTYSKLGRWKEAEELEVQVTQTSKRVLGDEHSDTLASMANLASMYRDQGRWKEAEELQMQVMQTRKRVLSDEHPDTLNIMAILAETYSKQGQWKEAEELQMQVVQTRKRSLANEHPDTLGSIDLLAVTYISQGRWKEAEELFMEVMQTRKRVLSDEHPDTLNSMASLAVAYLYQKLWKEAAELQVQIMQTRKRVLGDEHPDTLFSMVVLAFTYRIQGRWKEVEELQVQVMQIRKRVLGDEHPDTLASMHNLAFTLQSQARHREAFVLMETCSQLRKQVLGDQHPDTQSSLDTLRDWRAGCEQTDN